MGKLSTRASARAGAVVRALVRALSLSTSLLAIVSALFSPLAVSKASTLPFDLLTLQVKKAANSVRIEIAASRSFEDATIEQSIGAHEVNIRILGASSHLQTNYSGADRLVHSVRTISGGKDDGSWVDIAIDIDEGTAITFQRESNILLIEATQTSYFSPTRTSESSSPSSTRRNRAETTNSVLTVQPEPEKNSSNKTTDESVQLNRETANTSQLLTQAPSLPVSDEVNLLQLNIHRTSRTWSIEVLADRPVASLVVEQSVGATETLLRIRGAHSSLEPKYSSNDRLIKGVRTVSGGEPDSPWVDLIIETAQGAAISTQKNSNRLKIEVSQIAYFRGVPTSDKQNQKATRSAPSPTQSTSADAAQPVDSNLSELQVASPIATTKETGNKSFSQPPATSEPAKNFASAKSPLAESPSPPTASLTVPLPMQTLKDSATRGPAGESKTRVNDSNGIAKSPIETESKSPLSSVVGPPETAVNTPPAKLIVSAAQQQAEGQLHGVVVDEAGALVVGASIVLDDSHGHKYAAKTDDRGRYVISKILPGNYVLTATSEGFDTFKQEIEIAPQKIAALDVTLKIVVSVQVEVRAGPLNDLSGMILTESDIASLPKDPTQLLRKLRQMAAMMGIPDAAISVDGSPGDRLPPREDIQMIKISPHSFAAQYAQPTAGQIEITSRPSGHFHGDFSFNFNDESLNARDPFAPNRAPLQIREYNAYLSGPLIPGRWSFSAYLGRYDQDENSVINATVLDPATLLARPFNAVALTPNRQTYLSFGTSYLLNKRHTFRLKYSGSRSEQQNQGVGKFDLPERAYNELSRNTKVALSVTSIFSENKVNELYLQFSRANSNELSVSSAPAILVLDSFNRGGNQDSVFKDDASSNLYFGDTLSYPHKNHLFKAGIGLNSSRLRSIDRSNFGGTFIFGGDVERDSAGNPVLNSAGQPITINSLERYRRTLLGLPGYHPSQFSIVRGNPSIGISQSEMLWFLQDDWKLSPKLLLSYGLRHSFQTNIKDALNLAPRLGLAWRPSSKRNDTIRAGLGIFYDSVGSNITFDVNRFDGQHQQEITIQEPTFFPDVPTSVSGGVAATSTFHTKAPDLQVPYSIVSMISFQPQMPWGLSSSISISWQRSLHLLRSRNINAPIPGTNGLQPFMNQGPILQFESTGRSSRKALDFSLSKDITSKLSISGGYTLAFARSDTDGPYSSPANPYDLTNEFGRANGDVRHRVRLEAWSSLPGGFSLSPYFSISSGAPFNITTGRDENGDTIFTDRPSFGRLGEPGIIVTRFGVFNPNPALGDQIIPRNFGRRSRTINSGLNLSRSFSFGSGGDESVGSIFNRARRSVRGPYNFTFSLDVENLFNHTNFSDFNGVLTSPLFGRANSSQGPRKVKIGLELSFE
jgi:hypothetical protein